MAKMAENLSLTIQKSAINSILSYDALEEEVISKLLSNLQHIDHLDLESSISNEFLINYCQENNINSLNIFGKNSEKIFTNHPEHNVIKAKPIITDFIESSNENLIVGISSSRYSDQNNFVVTIKRSKGGAIVGNINANRLINFQKELGIGKLINTISEDSSIVYITIQDTIGILAASCNLDSLSNINNDEFLSNIYSKDKFQWRFNNFLNQKIFEGILPFKVQNINYGLIRIALSTTPIQTIQSETLKSVILKIIVLLTISFILLVYSISFQNILLLEDEKAKITDEVYRLQEDLRRKEKLSAMGELAAGVAHEIRNPLNAISMSVQRLGKSLELEENSKESNLIKTVRSEINRVGEIIRQFLNFARPAPLNKTKTNLNILINEVLDIYKAKLLKHNINLVWLPGKIKNTQLDAEKMKQVIVNLLENSISAMPDSGELLISTENNPEIIILKIKDTGNGISKDDLPKIFNLYFTTRPEGNGLGLAEVSQIIANHNGKIEVTSTINTFTEFIIRLPKE